MDTSKRKLTLATTDGILTAPIGTGLAPAIQWFEADAVSTSNVAAAWRDLAPEVILLAH